MMNSLICCPTWARNGPPEATTLGINASAMAPHGTGSYPGSTEPQAFGRLPDLIFWLSQTKWICKTSERPSGNPASAHQTTYFQVLSDVEASVGRPMSFKMNRQHHYHSVSNSSDVVFIYYIVLHCYVHGSKNLLEGILRPF